MKRNWLVVALLVVVTLVGTTGCDLYVPGYDYYTVYDYGYYDYYDPYVDYYYCDPYYEYCKIAEKK